MLPRVIATRQKTSADCENYRRFHVSARHSACQAALIAANFLASVPPVISGSLAVFDLRAKVGRSGWKPASRISRLHWLRLPPRDSRTSRYGSTLYRAIIPITMCSSTWQ